MPVTPIVLCAVSAVIAVIPCTPQRAKAFRSAWIPAPPPESEPAIDSTAGTDIEMRLGPSVATQFSGRMSGFGAMAATPADDLLAGYPVSEGIFDEGFGPDGRPRPAARAGLEAVARARRPRSCPTASGARCSAPACASRPSRATSSSTSTRSRA